MDCLLLLDSLSGAVQYNTVYYMSDVSEPVYFRTDVDRRSSQPPIGIDYKYHYKHYG
jgi:hypothetical protein